MLQYYIYNTAAKIMELFLTVIYCYYKHDVEGGFLYLQKILQMNSGGDKQG